MTHFRSLQKVLQQMHNFVTQKTSMSSPLRVTLKNGDSFSCVFEIVMSWECQVNSGLIVTGKAEAYCFSSTEDSCSP
jgi:hypothetical protein